MADKNYPTEGGLKDDAIKAQYMKGQSRAGRWLINLTLRSDAGVWGIEIGVWDWRDRCV